MTLLGQTLGQFGGGNPFAGGNARAAFGQQGLQQGPQQGFNPGGLGASPTPGYANSFPASGGLGGVPSDVSATMGGMGQIPPEFLPKPGQRGDMTNVFAPQGGGMGGMGGGTPAYPSQFDTATRFATQARSEEHTSELQSH